MRNALVLQAVYRRQRGYSEPFEGFLEKMSLIPLTTYFEAKKKIHTDIMPE
jgi:hypothetical protein